MAHARSIAAIAAVALAAALVPSASAAVAITGLTQPTSVTYDPAGYVYIAEKSGLIKMASSFSATTATQLINIQNQVKIASLRRLVNSDPVVLLHRR